MIARFVSARVLTLHEYANGEKPGPHQTESLRFGYRDVEHATIQIYRGVESLPARYIKGVFRHFARDMLSVAQSASERAAQRVVPPPIVIRSGILVPGRSPGGGASEGAMEHYTEGNAIGSAATDGDGTPGGEGAAAREGPGN